MLNISPWQVGDGGVLFIVAEFGQVRLEDAGLTVVNRGETIHVPWGKLTDLDISIPTLPKRAAIAVAVNRRGVSGGSVPWEGWGYVREYVEEVPGRAG